MLLFPHKIVFIGNEAALLGVTMQERARAFAATMVLIQLLPLKSLVFVVDFLNAVWDGNEAFPNGSSQNEIVSLLVVFHLPYINYKGVKICFYQCCYQNQNLTLVSHSFCSCSACFVLVSFVQHLCRTCVTFVLLVSHSSCQCRTSVAFVSLVSATRVIIQTRLFLCAKKEFQKSFKKTVFELFEIEMITVHHLRRQKKQYGILFPLFFFNEWLKKHGIMRNQFQEPKLHRQPEEFYSQWFL